MPLWLEEIAHTALLPLRNRNFRLFFIGQSLSLIGSWVHTTAQRWLMFELTHSASMLGILGAVGSLPVLLFSLPAGCLADRLPKKRLLLLSQMVAAFQALILALLVYFHQVKAWHVLALAFVLGSTVALEFPVRHSFIYELVGKEPLVAALSLHSTAFNLARFVGPALAGLLMTTLGLAWCFFFNAFSYLPVILALNFIVISDQKALASAQNPLEGIREGFVYAWRHRTIRTTLLLIAVTSIFLLPYAVLLPVLAKESFGAGAKGFSFLMAANGLGALFGAMFMASIGPCLRKDRNILVNLSALSLYLGLTALSKSLEIAAFFLLAAGFHMVCTFTSANAHLQLNTPDEIRGRILSLFSLSFLGLFPLGSFLSGLLAQHLGTVKVFLLGSIIGVTATLFVFWRGFGRRF